MARKLRKEVKKIPQKKWLITAIILVAIGLYLNRSYAYFFDYLGDHKVIAASEVVVNPYFYLPLDSVNTDNNARYFALGDSLTRGVGVADDKQAYPFAVGSLLAQKKRLEYANLAIPGSTTADLPGNQLRFLGDDSPDYISLLIGMNDVLTAVGTSQFKINYSRILDNLASRNSRLIIINIPSLSSSQIMLPPYNFLVDWRTQQFNSIIETLVRQKKQQGAKIVYIDLYQQTKSAFARDPSLYSVDKFHPSERGYKLWSSIINGNLNY
jgi:lysophospholipase L1-like esterase